MTLTIAADHLRNVMNLIRRIKPSDSMPIMEHLRITVPKGEPTAIIETTNLDIHLSTKIPIAGPTTHGSFTVPRAELMKIASNADKATTIRFDIDKTAISVSCTAAGLNQLIALEGMTASKFPQLDPVKADPVPFTPAAAAAVLAVLPGASKEDSRYMLMGVHLSRTMGGIAVATDGRRLFYRSARLMTPECTIPASAAKLFIDPLCTGIGKWHHDEKAALVTIQYPTDTTLTFKLLEGNYPNFLQVIPTDRKGSITFALSMLPNLTKWLRKLKEKTVRLEPANGKVAFKVIEKGQTVAETIVAAHLSDAPPKHICFNASFLADAFAADLHTVDLTDAGSPGVASNGETRCILMPMRVEDAKKPEKEPKAEKPEAKEPEAKEPATASK